MVAPDVGGGFGAKFVMYPEEVDARRRLPAAAAAGQMDRGPARAFPRRRAGARAVLGPRGRLRRRRPPARRARPADPRPGRLYAAGHQPSLQRLDRAARALHAAGLRAATCRSSRPTRSPPCRCAAPAIRKARSRWSALLDAVAGALGLDRAEVRRRNLVPAGEDAVRHAAQDPRRARRSRSTAATFPRCQQHRARRHRLRGLPGAPARARARRAAISASASATA